MTERELHDEMRRLWMEHVLWTRLYLVEAAAGLPGTSATLTRLLRNQSDIGSAFGSFYGSSVAAAVTGLLKEHISLAGAIVRAAMTRDSVGVANRKQDWYANAVKIANALASLCPYWPLDKLLMMMRLHLDRTLSEAIATLAGKHVESVAAYDLIEADILAMADALTSGIVRQFPSRFR